MFVVLKINYAFNILLNIFISVESIFHDDTNKMLHSVYASSFRQHVYQTYERISVCCYFINQWGYLILKWYQENVKIKNK